MKNLYSKSLNTYIKAFAKTSFKMVLSFKSRVLMLALVVLFIMQFNAAGQTVTNYTFTPSAGTFTNAGGTSPSLTWGAPDNGYWNAIPIGFDFYYLGVRYTTVSVSTNGWIAPGSAITNDLVTNNLTSAGAPRPVIAPLWDDLNIQAATNFTYITSGTAGSKVLTLQFLNNKWSAGGTGAAISFQVKLYESSGRIEFIYRPEAAAVLAGSASIGITSIATGSANFLSLNGTGTAPTASSTFETTGLSVPPASGQTYAFAATAANAATNLAFSALAYNGMTLNWTDNANNETGFVVYRSTDGTNFSYVTQLAANSTSYASTGLTASTLYYWRIYSLREGALSTALSASQATPCQPPSAPTVATPISYCQNATAVALTATGSNLLWGGAFGSVGGTGTFSTATTNVDNGSNNKKTNITTSVNNVTITTIDYYIPAYQTVTGLVLSIYNSSGAVIATSSTTTSASATGTAIKVTSTFNYLITTAGDYSIGVSAGTGLIGSNNPTFPMTEASGSIRLTGVSSPGLRCFNNIAFIVSTTATAPVPSTINTGSTNYYVSQTISGCTSALSLITVNVTAPNISQVPVLGQIANYPLNGSANDVSANGNPGTLQNGPTAAADRFGLANKAYTFNGTTQYISTSRAYNNPSNFTISIWFKTNTTTGGKLIGFGREQIGSSGQYDRHIYMNNSGQLYFGVYPGTVVTVNSALAYNDNKWHQATATLSSVSGMVLYVDGSIVGSNSATTVAENYTGYWRIAYDNNNGWNSQPANFYFNGTLDDVLIYDRALSASEVSTVYNSPDGAGNNGPVCSGSTLNLTSTTLPGATYSWSGPNGFSSTQQNPTLAFSAAAAGLYTVVITSAGCSSTAYTNVAASSVAGQWTGNISTDWNDANNWCSGVVPTSAVSVVINSTAVRMPSITASASCKSLTISSGASIITSAAGTLNIAGTLLNSGTMTNNGTTVFNGSTAQTFSGVDSFRNIVLNNPVSLSLPTTIIVKGDVTLTSGTLNTNNFAIQVAGNWTNNASTTALSAGTSSVNFYGSASQTIGGSFATTFNNLIVTNTGSTVTLLTNMAVAGNLTVTTGTLDLGVFTANRTTSGGILTVDNNAFLKIGGTNTYPSNYITNTLVVASTVEYNGTNQTVSAQPYGNLKLSSSTGAAVKTLPATAITITGNFTTVIGSGTAVTATAAAALTVNGIVSIGASTTLNGGSFTHTIGGNWVNSGTYNGNTGTIVFSGAGRTVSGAGTQNFNNLTVTGAALSFLTGSINIAGNLATSGSGSFSQVTGGTVFMTGTGTTISGTGLSLDNLSVSGTVTTASSLTLTGNLAVSGSITATAGTVLLSGTAKTITGAGTTVFNYLNITGSNIASANFSISAGLIVDGTFSATSGTATFTGNSTLSGRANLYTTVINGTSLQLSANSILGISNVLTITAGSLNVTSSVPNTVEFNGAAQNINAITYNRLVLTNGNTKSALSALTVNDRFTIASATTFAAGSYTHNLYADLLNNGVFSASTGTMRFTGAATATITGATTFNVLTIDKATSATTVQLLNDVSATTVNMTSGQILTGSRILTITVTRTGPGFIFGYIKRAHTFTTGTDYAFEGPDNTINFTSVSSVPSITVYVAKGTIADFPSGASINRVYDITIPSGTYSGKLRLHYEDNELNGNDESQLGLWNYTGGIWASAGAKSGNDITLNYVENSGIASLTNRWTLSGAVSEFTWSGPIDIDWNKAGNWKFAGVAAIRIPAATDVVKIGTEAFTNQPTISTAAVAKNIILGSAQAVTLSLASGGSLISGDIAGNWSANATHTLNVNSQTVTINGDLALSDGTTGHAINLNIGTGTVSTTGTVLETGGANITFTSTGTLKVGNDFTRVSGTFTAGSGTVEFNGAGNQALGNANFNNIVINKAGGIANAGESVTMNGNLTLTSGTLTNDSTVVIKGDVTIGTGTTLTNNFILKVGGNWLRSGTYNGQGINVIFDGAGSQSISATTFNNLEINKPVGTVATLTGDVTIKGNLAGTSGTLDILSFFFNRDVVGGTASVTDNGTLIIAADNAPNKFANYVLSAGSTIIFNGTGTQHLLLPGVVYGNITFRNSGSKLLYTPITVMGKFLIEPTATFDAQNNNITLYGNWENNGTFVPSTSTVIMAGTSKTVTGATTFNKVDITGSYSNLSNTTYNDLLHITSTGSLVGGTGIFTVLNGDLTNNGILNTNGTTTFTGNQVQTLSLINAVATFALVVNFNGTVPPITNSTSTPQYGFLNINNTGGVSPSVGWVIGYGLTVASGASFNCGVSSHTIYGNVTNNGVITSSGTISFLPPSPVTINLGTNFSSTGRVYFGGAGLLTLAGTPVSFGNINVNNTNPAGISPVSDWVLTKTLRVVTGSIFNAGTRTYTIAGGLVNTGTINAGTSTFIFNGTNTQEINSLSALNNVTLNKTGDSTFLSNDLTVNGVLNFIQGKITTGTYKLIQPSTGTITGASQTTGWIAGYLKKNISTATSTKTFEVGGQLYFTPATFNFSSVSTAGYLTVNTTASEHPSIASSTINANRSVNRYFTLANEGIVAGTVSGVLNYLASNVDVGANPLAFHTSNYNGSSWLIPVTGTRTSTSIAASGFLLDGDIAIGEICNFGTAISYSASPYCNNAGTASVTMAGTSGGVYSSDAGLAINASTGAVDLAASTLGTHNVVYTISSTSECKQFITSATVVIAKPGTWTGGTSTDWNNAANWACGGVPPSTADVTIPSGQAKYPQINTSIAMHDINVEPGALINLTGTMAISGAINNAGTFDASAGTIVLNSTAAQTIPGSAFYNNAVNNLTISNSSVTGVLLAGKVDIYNALTFTGSGKVLNTGDFLNIKSTATNTGRIGDLTGNAVSGKVTVERYINTGTGPGQHAKSWQLLSTPTMGQSIYNSWQEGGSTSPGYGVWITGPAGGIGYDAISPANSLKTYSSAVDNYVAVTNNNNVITNKNGYYLYVRGDRTVTTASGPGSTPVPTVLRTTGYIYQPNSLPSKVVVTKGKFETVGNPYASAIDLRYMRDNNLFVELNNDVTIWDPTIAGNYNSGGYQTLSSANDYMPTAPSTPTALYPAGVSSPYIQSGQAFFVHGANGAVLNGEISFTEGIKASPNRLVTRVSSTADRQYFRTYLHTATGVIADGNAVAFDDEFTNAIDADDALKIFNGGENFGLTRSAKALAVEARLPVQSTDTIYYNMRNLKQANYQLRIAPSNMDQSLTAILTDKFLNTTTNISVTDSSFINFTVTSNAASSAADRFNVVFRNATVLPVTFTSISALRKATTNVDVTWTVENELNVKGYSVERSNNGQQFSAIGSQAAGRSKYTYNDLSAFATDNYYRVKSIDANGKVAYSSIVKVSGLNLPASMSVYPNPVKDHSIRVQFSNQKAGSYHVTLTNPLGQTVYSGIVVVSGNSFVKQIQLDKNAAGGVYQLVVADDSKALYTEQIIVE